MVKERKKWQTEINQDSHKKQSIALPINSPRVKIVKGRNGVLCTLFIKQGLMHNSLINLFIKQGLMCTLFIKQGVKCNSLIHLFIKQGLICTLFIKQGLMRNSLIHLFIKKGLICTLFIK